MYYFINQKYIASKNINDSFNYFIPEADYCYMGLFFSVNI